MAGGLYLHEFATPSTGTASAGSHAWANDASIAFHNPAGMTRIDGDQFMVGSMALLTTVEFEPDTSTPNSGGGGGDAGGFIPAGGAYFVHSFSDDLKLGVSLASLSGAALDYDNTWTGRYQALEVDVLTLYFTPSIGYKVNDWLSVSAGVSVIYAEIELDVAVPVPGLPDGRVTLDGDETEFSFNLSALIELSKNTRLGFVYWYETEFDFSGDLSFSKLGLQVGTDTELVLPQKVEASIYHELNNKIALMGSVGWENWSKLENVNVSVRKGTAQLPKNWEDTWHFAGGIHYRLSAPWLLQCGIAYDTSPVSSGDRTADMPVDRQLRYAVGVLHNWSEKLTIGTQLEYIDAGSANINSSNLLGEYDKNNIIVASISFNWKW
jgi:long-chain fatty acid transport protein